MTLDNARVRRKSQVHSQPNEASSRAATELLPLTHSKSTWPVVRRDQRCAEWAIRIGSYSPPYERGSRDSFFYGPPRATIDERAGSTFFSYFLV